MKLNIRLIALLLTMIMALSLFAACDSEPAETTAPENDQTTEAPADSTGEETEAPVSGERTSFDLIVNGEAQAMIIRPKDLGSDNPQVAAAVKIRNKIEDTTDVKFKMGDDFKKATEEFDASTMEGPQVRRLCCKSSWQQDRCFRFHRGRYQPRRKPLR